MPRKQAQLRGPKDRDSQQSRTQNRSQNKTTKRKAGKGLDALAIAEAEYPIDPRIRRSRLGVGDDDDFSKRKRDDADGPDTKRRRTGEDDSSDNDGSDADGREWKIGEVDSDDDEELDSDEAMGSSDDELFEGFAFRGSSTTKSKPNPKQKKEKKTRQLNLSEDVDESDEEMNDNEEDGDEEDDDLGEDAVDLLTAWDMNTAAEEEAAKKAAAKAKKAATDDYDEESGSQDEDSDDESSEDDDALSVSDDDADVGNEHGLSRLQDFVNSMETDATSKPTKKKGSAQEQSKPTEYGLTSSKKLTVADLLPSISDSRLKNSLKHVDSTTDHKQSSGIPGKLDAPAPKRQQDRMDREAAYEKSKETMDRWLETVKANRRAEHLVFPLPNPDAQLVHKLDAPKPQNDLESTIQNILVESGLATTQGKSNEDEVKEFEELEGRKLPIEEIRARRAELRKRRELMFREEVRAKRIKKIKSKSYRRVHRKERERLEQQERQALIDAGVDLDEEEKEKMERQRAEARMGSKHKDSKWAKSLRQTGRTAWDEEARLGAAGQALKEEELRKRIEGKRVSNGDDDYLDPSSSESEDEDPWAENGSDVEKEKIRKKISALEGGDAGEEYKGPHAKLLSMKFMQNADAARKEQNDAELRKLSRGLQGGEESQSEAESEVGRRKFGQSKTEEPERKPEPFRKNELEEAPDSDDEDAVESRAAEMTQETSKPKPSARPAKKEAPARISNNASKQQETVDEVEENPWLVQTNRTNRKANVNDSNQSVDISINDAPARAPAPKSSNVSKDQKSKAPPAKKPQIAEDAGSDDEDQVPVLLKNHDLVKKAFAGDEVVQEFEQEKLDTIEDEGDKVVDNTLPGWGSWAGEGVSKKQQKRQKRNLTTIEGVKPEQRKDAKLSKVIINEKRQKKNNKYMASQLPHQFETKQQYERSLRLPIGPEWTTKETVQNATKPRIMIKQGIIKPMEKPMV
ncbi:UTP14 family protein [Aspergillus chevalieri]|uniref:Uncharacterized protein n=1 Tax=Aspergillus chevalieri TaxID=182096 RepID=A0A7R7VGC7_ASPCH|nr:uncharacterized protein ACHE_11597S [Aspergillus chevalieri]BCR84195.1 hypothetical protein ACHE_11597S [Aspergillus chevalieri]